ncbi:hypothetical protein LVJ94_14325 [Pendulispora rubella]|uniref:Capsule polysaccharide biosynthesis protein n=1 Tax=Pendulispora rubella TaxID=2741070 RepID=A0ABZ2LBX3_9BACT
MSEPTDSLLDFLGRPSWKQLIPRKGRAGNVVQSLAITKAYVKQAHGIRKAFAHYGPLLQAASKPGDLAGRKILIFAYKIQWFDTSCAMALALAARGAEVSIAWLPHVLAVPLSQPHAEVAVERIVATLYRRALPSSGPVRGIELANLPEDGPSEPAANVENASRLDVHYLAKREQIDIGPGGRQRELYEFRLERNARAYRLASSLLARERFDSAIIPNGMIFEFASFARACNAAKLDYVTYEFWEKRYSCMLNLDRPVFERFEERMWSLSPKQPSERARERVLKSMATREGTEWKDFALKYQTSPLVSSEELRRSLSLDEGKPIVLVLPNVPFDTAVIGTPGAFSTLGAWFESTLRILARRDDCQVVIRAHPAEIILGANETAKEMYERAIPQPPAHFRFIASDQKVNTYALMKMTSVGLVYSSTTGLELAMRGVPSVVATQVHYARKGFTIDVENEADLERRIGELLKTSGRLEQSVIDLSWAYADMYMNRLPRPFPFVPVVENFWAEAAPNLDAAMRDTLSEEMRDSLILFAGRERARTLYARIAASGD